MKRNNTHGDKYLSFMIQFFCFSTLKLLSENLTTLELLQVYNKNVLPFVKEDDIVPKQQKPTQGKKRLKK